MPANATLTSTESVDLRFALMRPFFAQASQGTGISFRSGARWVADKVTLQLGPEPSSALIRIPMAAVSDEVAPAIAGITTSPLQGIKIGTPLKVEGYTDASSGNALTLMAGRVVEIHADMKWDRAEIEMLDERWILQACQISGSFWASGSTQGSIEYRQGIPFHTNPKGEPNALWVSDSNTGQLVPVLCPKNFGLSNGETPPASAACSTTKACHWTPWMIWKYLRFAFDSGVYTAYIATKFPWYAAVPSSIDWPPAPDSMMEQANSDITAKSQEFIWEGLNLMAALERSCNMAGPFTPYLGGRVTVNADKTLTFRNELSIERKRYNGEGISIDRPISGNAAAVLGKAKTIIEGTLSERGRNLYTRLAVAGELVYIQNRIHNDGSTSMEAAWTSSDQAAAQAYYRERRDAGNSKADALAKTWRRYRNVFSGVRINPNYNFQSGTSQSDYPRATTNRVPLPHLLTSYLEGTSSTIEEKARYRRPTLVEYKDTTWKLADWNDGFSIDDDLGVMFFDGLREQQRTFAISGNDVVGGNTAVFTARPLRMTLAIPCDHRLTAAYKLASDPTEGVNVVPADPNGDDADRIDRTLSRLLYADANGLNVLEIVYDSWSIPEAVDGASADTDGTLRDDSSKLGNQSQNRILEAGRLDRGGTLIAPWLRFAWAPGTAVREMRNSSGAAYPIRAVVYQVVFDLAENRTSLGLA